MEEGKATSDKNSKEVGVGKGIGLEDPLYVGYLEDDAATTLMERPQTITDIVDLPEPLPLAGRPSPPCRRPGAFPVAGNGTRNRTGSGRSPTAAATPPAEEEPLEIANQLPQQPANNVPCIHHGLAQATPVPEPAAMMEARPFDIEASSAQESQKKTKQRKTLFCLAIILLCVIIPIVVAFGFGKEETMAKQSMAPSEAPSGSPSQAPSSTMEVILGGLPNYTLAALEQFSTPQWKAMDWLSRHPNIANLEEWRKSQLFALATFYYAMDGDSWQKEMRERWLQYNVPECLWFSSMFGVFVNGQFVDSATLMDVYLVEQEVGLGFDEPCNQRSEFLKLLLYGLQPSNKRRVVPPEIVLLTSLTGFALPGSSIQGISLSEFLPSNFYSRMPQLQQLHLQYNHLRGSIPTQMGLFANLNDLTLLDNLLTGSIPTEFGKMAQMTDLRLDINGLTNRIPTELGRMTNMLLMDLSENALTGPLPSQLGRMSHMTSLYAPRNILSGTLPSELGRMTRLTMLYLTSNAFSGTLPSQVVNMSDLATLQLDNNAITGTLPRELGFLSGMEAIILNNNDLKGSIPTELGMVTGMIELSLEMNSLSGPIPSELGLMTSLTSLNLEDNNLTGTLPAELKGLAFNGSLTALTLANNSLSGTIPEIFCPLGIFDPTIGRGISFDCSANLCGCCWCPCPDSNYSSTVCNILPWIPSRDHALWPGDFPIPFNRSNAVTINVYPDQHPEELSLDWSLLDASEGWILLETNVPLGPHTLSSYTKEVESEALYRLRISDSWGDGTCCVEGMGWFTITSSTPSQDLAGGSTVWEAPGYELEEWLEVYLWIDSNGQARHANYIPGQGYALVDDTSVEDTPGTIVVQEDVLSSLEQTVP